LRLGRRVAVHDRLRIANAVADTPVTNGAGGLRQLARGLTLFLCRLARRAIELLLEGADLGFEIVFTLVQLPNLRRPGLIGRSWKILHSSNDLLLLASQLVGLPDRVLYVAFGSIANRALQPAFRLTQTFKGCSCLCGSPGIAARGRPAHRIRRLLHLAGRLGKVWPVLLASQPLEPPCRFFHLFGQRTLLSARGAAR
jgi:hypothetical protein